MFVNFGLFKDNVLAKIISPFWCLITNALIQFILRLSSGDHIHTLSVEFLHASSEVVDIESVGDAHSKIRNLEIKPICISSGIAVDLHQQIVVLSIVNVDRVQVAALEILVKDQDVFVTDPLWQFRLELIFHIFDHMNWQFIFIKFFFRNQSTDVVSGMLQVFGSVSIIDLICKEIGIQLSFDGLLCRKNNLFTVFLVLFLILSIFLLLF